MRNFVIAIHAFVFALFFSCNQPINNANNRDAKVENELEIYQWRGPNRSGIYSDTGLLKIWPENGPEKVWEFNGIGNGYGSPVFTYNGMYILGEVDSIAYLFAFDSVGNLLWKRDIGYEWVTNFRGSRSTPTVVNNLVYVTSGMGLLCCFNRLNGHKVWSVDMVHDLHGTSPLFGYSESVIVNDSMVFCTPGGADTNVVALNRFTGNIIWISKGAGQRPGYNSPQIIEVNGRSILVNFSAYQLMGHDAQTGQLLWVHNQDNVAPDKRGPGMGDTHGNTIIYDNGCIYYAAGDGNGGVKLTLSDNGKSISEVWRNTDFDSYMGGIIKIGDYLFGSGTAKPNFKSINAQTGQVGATITIGSGIVISADSMLYYYNQRGEVFLISANPINMQVVSKFKINFGNNEHFAHPAINQGKLYIRHGSVIQAFRLTL